MFVKSTIFILHFAPSLRFTLSLQSAVCILHSICILPLVRSLQSAVRSLRLTLTDFNRLSLPFVFIVHDHRLQEYSKMSRVSNAL